MKTRSIAALFPLLLAAGVCQAQTGALKLTVELRTLSTSSSNPTYGSLQVENPRFVARLTGSEKRTYSGNGFQLRHGGSDLEAAYRIPRLEGIWEVGIARPDTAERRNDIQGTLRLNAAISGWQVTPKAVFGEGGMLAGITVGRELPLGENQVFLEATPIVVGNNTRSITNGQARRTVLWSAGIRHKSVTLGVSNAVGLTTGMSLTPQLRGAALLLRWEGAL